MTTAAQLREMRRSESCKWFPVSTPRPIMKGVCVMRAYRRAPSGETTSRTASPARGTVSGMGEPQCGNYNMCEEAWRWGGRNGGPLAKYPQLPMAARVRDHHLIPG